MVGQSVREALPELEPRFLELLDRVYATGKPFVGNSLPATLPNASGETVEVFVDFVYQPLNGPDGKPSGILVSGYDVTARVKYARVTSFSRGGNS